MKGVGDLSIPKGPTLHNYDFRVTYYEQPIDKEYEPIITSRLLAGVPPLAAVRGTPVKASKVYRWRKKLGMSHKDVRPEYGLLYHSDLDGYDVVDMFLNKNMSLREIAKRCNCSVFPIFRVLKKMGVTNAKEHRYKNPTEKDKKRRIEFGKRAAARSRLLKHSPGKRKYLYWLKHKGKILMPVYEDVVKGMSMAAACKKHGVTMHTAKYHFKRMQRLDNQCLAWGKKLKFPLMLTKAQIRFYEQAAKKSNNNVLDWVISTLNAAAQAHARNQS